MSSDPARHSNITIPSFGATMPVVNINGDNCVPNAIISRLILVLFIIYTEQMIWCIVDMWGNESLILSTPVANCVTTPYISKIW